MAPAQGWHANSWSVPYFYLIYWLHLSLALLENVYNGQFTLTFASRSDLNFARQWKDSTVWTTSLVPARSIVTVESLLRTRHDEIGRILTCWNFGGRPGGSGALPEGHEDISYDNFNQSLPVWRHRFTGFSKLKLCSTIFSYRHQLHVACEGKSPICRYVWTDFTMGCDKSCSQIRTSCWSAPGTNWECDFGCTMPGRPGSGGVNWV